LVQINASYGATVDTLQVPSVAMNKIYKAAVVLPNSYAKSKANFPVLYLLHGAMVILTIGCLKLNKTLIQQLSDQYNIIIVPGEKHLVST
jgi:predicted alpha/beta superfamily hydrolase